MIDHIGIAVADFDKSRAFYVKTLASLGLKPLLEFGKEVTGSNDYVGFGDTRPFFWIGTGDKSKGGNHIAFAAATRAMVDSFHAAALAAGAVDNGRPGLRPHYHGDYYGAFVFDPDGNNIEAVCHTPA